ncbi:uncharacterized protein [Lepeophtheirus salmonis]|uniref:Tudor domain-containing protein n=1 Tax=Lepeophtheirus salmonis TaxID=72036 RepID=A0A0K2TGN0_LEPSM|nr:tudor domain-containing protein 3-like [Lepeophtheirus salmonis]
MSGSKGKHLLIKGFRLTEEGLNLTEGNYEKALDFDLREIAQPFFPSEIDRRSRKIDSLENKDRVILQVKSIKNVSIPKIEESRSGIPRLLKIALTDGFTSMFAVEINPLDNISTETPPGTKVQLMDVNLDIVSGFILLRSGSIKVLGGRVDRLAESWEISRKFASFKRDSSSSSGPPPWVSFGKSIAIHPTLNEKEANPVNIKQNGKEERKSEEPSEFDSQRKDAIEEAAKSGYQKVFGGGSQEIKDGKKGMTRHEEIAQRKRNKRGNKENEADALSAKPPPSSRVCLFDFMEKKIPSKENDAGVMLHHDVPITFVKASQPELNEVKQHSGASSSNKNINKREKQAGGRSYNNSNSGYNSNHKTNISHSHHNQQSSHVQTNDNYPGNNTTSDSKNRNNNRRNDYADKKDNRRDKPHQQQIQQQQQHKQQREPQQQKEPQQQQQKLPDPNKKQQQRGPNPRSRRNENSDRDFGEWNNSTYTETQSQRKPYEENRGFSNSNYKGTSKKKQQQQHHHHQWKANDLALAKYWEDGLYYPVKIREVTSTTALVCFEGYENFEEVLFKDLKPKELMRKPQQQNSHQHHPHH